MRNIYVYYTRNNYKMVIDILLLVVACVALIRGWRKGAIVQLLQLVGIYVAMLVAADHADKVGSLLTSDPGISYILGYVLIIVAGWLFVWIIAPLFRKLLFFEVLRKFDSLLGMFFSFAAALVIVSLLLSLFVTANLGSIRTEKVLELGSNGLTPEQIKEYAEMIERKDESLRDYFEPKYIDFETLEESEFFYPLADFGAQICPGLKDVERQMVEWSLNMAAKYDRE